MIYQVDCSVQLDSKKYYEMAIWNLFCRKKIYPILMAIAYGFGLMMAITALPAIAAGGNNNTAILNCGMGVVLVVIVCYMLYSQVSRIKRTSKNEEWLKKTAKHFRFTKEMISNYRVDAAEERKYEWNQVSGAYNMKNDVVISTKKDEQLLILDKEKLSEKELEFITGIITEKNLWKKSMSLSAVKGIFITITLCELFWAVSMFVK